VRLYTFVTVVDVEGESEDDARSLLEEFFTEALEVEAELAEEYQVASFAVLSPATFVSSPDDYFLEEEDDFVDDVESITTDPAEPYE
jgi:hypothetical protein